jgi:sigma-B regulation protein RsbU (phosphoserine phosphatase)
MPISISIPIPMPMPIPLPTDLSAVFTNSLLLFQAMCVIVLAAYLVTRSRQFAALISGEASRKNLIVLTAFFGLLSIYGSVAGVSVAGVIINTRDLGPIVGGLTCGPLVGIGAGLIGALFRSTQGGFTVVPCTIATFLSGLLGGLIYLRRGRFPGITLSVVFAGSMEIFHMLLTLLLARPYSQALAAVEGSIVPMVFANALGVLLFTFIVSNFLKEEETKSERDRYRKELERKEAEIALAADIQRSFLPHSTPSIPGFDLAATTLPALEVGGDFYDFIPEEGGMLGLVIADAAGKSVPAALFMALSKIIVRTNALTHESVADVLKDSNEVIAAQSGSGMFVTLFFGILNQKSGNLVYANAGHNPPLIFRAKDARFDTLGTTGIALGIMEGSEYSQGQITLGPGDILVMYTDGIVEAVNPQGEQFGLQRLRSIIAGSPNLAPDNLLREIVQAVSVFSAGQQQFDDITALVVKASSKIEAI